jgi:hypothetical protein
LKTFEKNRLNLASTIVSTARNYSKFHFEKVQASKMVEMVTRGPNGEVLRLLLIRYKSFIHEERR